MLGARRVHGYIWMQTTGAAQDRDCLPRLFRLSTAAQGRRCALGLLYFAAVQHSSRVGRDHLIRRVCHGSLLPGHMPLDLPGCLSSFRIVCQSFAMWYGQIQAIGWALEAVGSHCRQLRRLSAMPWSVHVRSAGTGSRVIPTYEVRGDDGPPEVGA